MLLKGLHVIEWSEALPAAYCTRILADLGAEVVKIERPACGDPLRRAGPFLPGRPYGEDGALFAYVNHGKRSITLDPTKPSGALLFRQLLASYDALVHSQNAEVLRAAAPCLNPALVVVAANAFGQNFADVAMTDLTLTHHAAYAFHQSRPVQSLEDQPPTAGADHEIALAAGVAAATATLSAVLEAEQTGIGRQIDCAEADVIAHLLIEPIADYGRGERRFSRLRENLSGTEVAGGLIWLLPCTDGFVMVSPREQHQWDRWVGVLGNPAWAADAVLCGTREARNENWRVLQKAMSVWTEMHSRTNVFARAQAARVACFPVSRPRDLLENPQLSARGFFDRLPTGEAAVPMPGLPFVLRSSAGVELERSRTLRAPALGEANADILEARLGLAADQLEPLRRHGVV